MLRRSGLLSRMISGQRERWRECHTPTTNALNASMELLGGCQMPTMSTRQRAVPQLVLAHLADLQETRTPRRLKTTGTCPTAFFAETFRCSLRNWLGGPYRTSAAQNARWHQAQVSPSRNTHMKWPQC